MPPVAEVVGGGSDGSRPICMATSCDPSSSPGYSTTCQGCWSGAGVEGGGGERLPDLVGGAVVAPEGVGGDARETSEGLQVQQTRLRPGAHLAAANKIPDFSRGGKQRGKNLRRADRA